MLGGREVAGRAAETLPQGSGVRGVGGKDGEWGRRVCGNPWGHGGGARREEGAACALRALLSSPAPLPQRAHPLPSLTRAGP